MPELPVQDLHQAKKELSRGADELGLDLSAAQREAYARYVSLLIFWNRKINLTGAKDPLTIVRRHILDSLAVSRFLRLEPRLVDVGSGAGFPGLVLKILYRSKPISLVEPRRKRATFLREVIRNLSLVSAEVLEERIERVSNARRGQFDEATARAFGSPQVLFPACYQLLSNGGTLYVMHGPKGERQFPFYEKQARGAGFTSADLISYSLPLSGERRSLLRFSKGST